MKIRFDYDPTSRTFRLVDHESRIFLEGDGLYDLAIPFLFAAND